MSAMSPLQSELVGREDELDTLKEHLSQTMQGNGRLVFVTGVAGVGKSHFLEQFKRHALSQGVKVLTGKCLYNESPIPYFPFIEALKQMEETSKTEPSTMVGADDPPLTRFGMGMLGVGAFDSSSTPEDSSLGFLPFNGVLDIDTSIQKLDLSQERSRIFDEVYLTIEKIAEKEPLLLIIDDLQWVDEATLQLLHYSISSGQ